ncbi:hypothetical protein KJ853_00760 [Patescibacteria group bacterium]|nr:hypothetical protein [Patescibacteria group bacterium]
MKNSKIIFWSAINSLATAIYVSLVAYLLFNGGKIFGQATNFWMPVALLLLFVISATITGLLVLGRPVYLFLNGAKTEALKLLFYTIGFLALIMVIVFITLLLIK